VLLLNNCYSPNEFVTSFEHFFAIIRGLLNKINSYFLIRITYSNSSLDCRKVCCLNYANQVHPL
jgi:hypothetical protein